jgi:hypothetical protein
MSACVGVGGVGVKGVARAVIYAQAFLEQRVQRFFRFSSTLFRFSSSSGSLSSSTTVPCVPAGEYETLYSLRCVRSLGSDRH